MEGNEKLVLTVKETACRLRISRGLAYEAIRQGIIPSIRIGWRILIPRKALEEMITSGTPGNLSQASVQNLAK